MDDKPKSEMAWQDSFNEMALADDMVSHAEYGKWQWVLKFTMFQAIIHALWAIYFKIKETG